MPGREQGLEFVASGHGADLIEALVDLESREQALLG
jgi:hypothetical protein